MTDLSGRGPLGLKSGKGEKKPRKAMRPVSAKKAAEENPLRENAEGKPCTLRLPGCRASNEYTVLAHIRRFAWGGAALKPNDLLAFFACDICHEKQERHDPECTSDDLLRALGETLVMQEADGLIETAPASRNC